ncbi:hypothetical protein QQZ08_005116 [Neonectria magnoliae]|uniref:Uncharacterized protein n=1 Tax=Neonectria magnoliae TaxID=2732573 RepID=A0ABR1I5R1_9HYPO
MAQPFGHCSLRETSVQWGYFPTAAPPLSNHANSISPFGSGSHTPIIPSVTSTGNDAPQSIPGDPSKQTRLAADEPAGDVHRFARDVAPLTADGSSASSSRQHAFSLADQTGLGKDTGYILDETEEHGRKKRRRDSDGKNAVWVYDEESHFKDLFHDPYWNGCVTPWNSHALLADVNWELGKMEE